MTSRMLPVIRENADYDIERCLSFFTDGQGGAKLLFKLCRAYRRRGICEFFLTGSRDKLHADLQLAGVTFAAGLERNKDLLHAASKAEPIYDAIACGDIDTVRRIAALLPGNFTAGEEYEEDFYSILTLATLVLSPSAVEAVDALLQPFGELAADSDDLRFQVLYALAGRDGDLFAIAMEQLLQAREGEYARAIEFEEVVEDEWATEGQFFVEGLAIVRVARMLGIPTDEDYLYIPSLAIQGDVFGVDIVSPQGPQNSNGPQ